LGVLLPELKNTVSELEKSDMIASEAISRIGIYNMLMINLISSTALLLRSMLQSFW